jgi:hypothetical protein
MNRFGVALYVLMHGTLTIVSAIGRFPIYVWIAIFGVMFLVGEIAVLDGTLPMPRWASDWYTRPMFMKGCTGMNWDDKRVFDACQAAYERYQTHEHVGWKE